MTDHQRCPVTLPHRLDPGGANQHGVNAGLREHGAAVPIVLPGEVSAYAVVRHEELEEFLGDPAVAKDSCHFAALHAGELPANWPLTAFATVQGMTTADGDEHRRLRGLVTKAFTPRRVEALRPRVRERTEQLLDQLADTASAAPDGIVDLREHFALPLPLGVICELLGVDPTHEKRLHELSHDIVSTAATPQRAKAATQEMYGILSQVAADRRAAPGGDLTSALIAAKEEDGDRLSEEELAATLLLMIIAGHETNLHLITNAVRALSGHRDQLALVLSGAVGWDAVVEETLRYDSPVSFFPFRYPTTDVTVGDTVIPRGAPVLASYTAAGRDPLAYGPDADQFDITRETDVRNLAFSHGAHYCLGAPLARLESTIALEMLYARFPDLTPAVPEAELPPHPSFIGNSTHTLPVRLTGGDEAR
ncbi:cytochrome P450 family protein [Streptomyces zagrosensis]|uniref:Cytochrome P450 n=1 Tax=Streptomyces zagrosensis TaxID=1042984 RepID=A0A7W9Q5A9_9ACTN|nr:cytochrome P450 [Streptomyces zagrosensis]MBB5933087.1 cytochrome P450 [Streptomyces zagrosensis]